MGGDLRGEEHRSLSLTQVEGERRVGLNGMFAVESGQFNMNLNFSKLQLHLSQYCLKGWQEKNRKWLVFGGECQLIGIHWNSNNVY